MAYEEKTLTAETLGAERWFQRALTAFEEACILQDDDMMEEGATELVLSFVLKRDGGRGLSARIKKGTIKRPALVGPRADEIHALREDDGRYIHLAHQEDLPGLSHEDELARHREARAAGDEE